LIATDAVASLAAAGPQAKEFVQELWNAPIPSGEQRYYDGMLYLMSLMHCGGRFRIWTPK
jgi:oligosaccharide reducing-end xylanase